MREAVERAHNLAESGDAVLLAPACASFDMFTSYEHRGRVFKQEVRSLQQSAFSDQPETAALNNEK